MKSYLGYNSASMVVYVVRYRFNKSDDSWKEVGRIDFSTTEASKLCNIIAETVGTSETHEYRYPSDCVKFVCSLSRGTLTIEKYTRSSPLKNWWSTNSIVFRINETPALTIAILRALIFSTLWDVSQ